MNTKREYTTIQQPNAITMMRPSVDIFVENGKKGEVLRRARSITVTDMKTRYRALQSAQQKFNELKKLKMVSDDFLEDASKNLVAVIDISTITDTNHYKDVDDSARKLIRMPFVCPQEDESLHEITMFGEVKRKKGKKQMTVSFTPPFLKLIFSDKGWTSYYDIDVVCSLGTVPAMKMYEIIARRDRNGQPVIIPFGLLKDVLLQGARYNDKYGPANFDRYVMDKTKKELDAKAPYSFEYHREMQNDGWVYYIQPYHIPKNDIRQETKLAKQIELGLQLPQAKKILQYAYGFTREEIKNNNKLFLNFEKVTNQGLAAFLEQKKKVAFVKDNPKAWIIGTIKEIYKTNGVEI